MYFYGYSVDMSKWENQWCKSNVTIVKQCPCVGESEWIEWREWWFGLR